MKKKYQIIVFMISVLICGALCYVPNTLALTTTKSQNEDLGVYFDNVKLLSTNVKSNNTIPLKIDDGKCKFTYDVNLDVPGDYYQFSIDVVNTSNEDVKIDNIVMTELSDSVKKFLKYEVVYSNKEKLKRGDVIAAGGVKTLIVEVKYRDDLNPIDLPQNDVFVNLDFQVNYVSNNL